MIPKGENKVLSLLKYLPLLFELPQFSVNKKSYGKNMKDSKIHGKINPVPGNLGT